MDKNEIIRRLQKQFSNAKNGSSGFDIGQQAAYSDALFMAKCLNVPKPPRIPPTISVYIDHCKALNYSLHSAIDELQINEDSKKPAPYLSSIAEWLLTDNNEQVFEQAWVNGHIVNKQNIVQFAPVTK